jgi:hypothetical protein
MEDEDLIRRNCESVLNPLSDKETEIKDYVEERFFKPLMLRHWEGVEVQQYWKAMKGDSSFQY